MKRFCLILPVIALLLACNSSTEVQPVATSLEDSYQSGKEEYVAYLMQWYSESYPVSPDEFNQLSDTLKTIYRIYETFYDPFNLEKLCTTGRCPEFGTDFYQGLKYIIVQNEIKYIFEGGEANYRRIGDRWELIESKLTWIE